MNPIKKDKVVMLGSSNTGKTSIISRFVLDQFDKEEKTSIGAGYSFKIMNVDNTNFMLQIWDTAGQEKYLSLAQVYYRDAPMAIVVYDVSDLLSYVEAQKWVSKLQSSGVQINRQIVLCANKNDLKKELWVVDSDDARLFAKINGLAFFETSALQAKQNNIDNMFSHVVQMYLRAKIQQNEDKLTLNKQSGKCCQ
ncbi:Rab11 [Hexamita inflata]|uniref:Rab11 n=1 Tax=Hexamita inflata TaxID=28002 RepID=A0AA86NH51_9EUKA|nr:Rab11 [Hexamita inflata]